MQAQLDYKLNDANVPKLAVILTYYLTTRGLDRVSESVEYRFRYFKTVQIYIVRICSETFFIQMSP